MMKPNEMPEPELLIEYEDGSVAAAMFHYAAEGQRYDHIAREQGFDVRWLTLESDEENSEIQSEYEEGSAEVVAKWKPEIPAGWMLACKQDTEDGPFAMFIRKQSERE